MIQNKENTRIEKSYYEIFFTHKGKISAEEALALQERLGYPAEGYGFYTFREAFEHGVLVYKWSCFSNSGS